MIYDASAFEMYIRHPYLAKATEGQLAHRIEAITANLWIAPPPGIPQIHKNTHTASFWAKKLTEARTERFRRSRAARIYTGGPRAFVGFDETRLLSDVTLDNRALNAVRALSLPPSPFLVRFTDARYVESALRHGKFQIAPASRYDDPSLNAAQRDDELSHAAIRGDSHIMMEFSGYLPGEPSTQARPMPVEWGEMFDYMNSANFYVLCLTNQFDARMFRDFKKGAAIIIRDPTAFVDRLSSVTKTHHPELQFRAEPVTYYDPYTVSRPELQPGFSKNFTFAYQSEFRPTWWPRDPATRLSAFFIEIGALTDIAEAIFL